MTALEWKCHGCGKRAVWEFMHSRIRCKACWKVIQQARSRKAAERAKVLGVKRCSRCREEKPLSAFQAEGRNVGICRSCKAAWALVTIESGKDERHVRPLGPREEVWRPTWGGRLSVSIEELEAMKRREAK